MMRMCVDSVRQHHAFPRGMVMISLRDVLRATATTTASALLLGGLALAAAPDLQAQVRPDSTRATAGAAQPRRQPATEAQPEELAALMGPVMGPMIHALMQSNVRALAMPETA